jgi:murein DD-endopeptidase MepM/ murein hydrolase activator NlpD
LRTITLARDAKGKLLASEVKAAISKSLARAGGTIRSSLYQTAIDSGVPVKMVAEIIQAYSYDVDFQRDVHPGDRLDVVFERLHTDKNVTAGIGKMMYASLTLGGKDMTIYRHTSADGFTGYYNTKGESVRKALLRTPINGAHITSGFGMRHHPLLGYSKMHKGVDFGAPTGTPIYAAGDGVIEEAGRKGGYGNYVKLRHNKTYATAYGHASRIAKGIRPGVHVRQGQIIAYVGSTGASTGPHLHYEIIAGNAQVNPSGVKFRTGQQLGGKEYAAFRKNVKQVESLIASTGGTPRKSKTQVALR